MNLTERTKHPKLHTFFDEHAYIVHLLIEQATSADAATLTRIFNKLLVKHTHAIMKCVNAGEAPKALNASLDQIRQTVESMTAEEVREALEEVKRRQQGGIR